MKIAVNMCDISDLSRKMSMVGLLLDPFCSRLSATAQISKAVDGLGIVLDKYPAGDDSDRLTALVELLQTSIGPRKLGRRVRCYYQNSRGNWTEIRPGSAWQEKAEKAANTLQERASRPVQMGMGI